MAQGYAGASGIFHRNSRFVATDELLSPGVIRGSSGQRLRTSFARGSRVVLGREAQPNRPGYSRGFWLGTDVEIR